MLDRKTTCVFAAFVALVASAVPAAAADVTIDRSKTYQTIEGFGFFGGADVWWSGATAVLDQTWTQKVIDDLGITLWRNEYYAAGTPQDSTWAAQKPVVQGLVNYAAQKGVKLKILLTVWSPPASMKCLSDDNVTCNSNPPTRPADTKGGNILDPAMRADLATWLVAGAQMYHDAGADLYALSFQNEPLFKETYNSCVYKQDAYAQTLAAIGPTLKAAFPGLKLFASENMLGTECGKSPGTAFDPYWYTANIMNVPGALAAIDAFAVHGYVDGISASATSKLAALWTSFRSGTAATGKAIWMTETSGYTHTWPGTSSAPGPLDLGQAIYAALTYGNLSAWAYWQGSDKGGYDEYSLMAGASSLGKNYYVAKQFYRFIRPGAQRVDLQSSDPELMAVAFQHPTMNSFTLVAINTGSASKTLSLAGAGLPADFHAFRTSASENAVDLGAVTAASLVLPASSITTFVNGSYREVESPGGTGGAGGAAGIGGAGGGGNSGKGGATGTGGSGTGAAAGATGIGGASSGGNGGRGGGGGANAGGRPGSGGSTAIAGATGTGGKPATGGIVGSTGGASGSGKAGATGTGGGNTGGATATGGAASAGKPGTAGVPAGSGGSSIVVGGSSDGGMEGVGGAGGTSGSISADKANGCSCRIAGPHAPAPAPFIVLWGALVWRAFFPSRLGGRTRSRRR